MKKYLFLILTTIASVTLAYGEERQLLTMEDAILNPALTPQRYITKWGTDAKGKTIYAAGATNKDIKWAYPGDDKAAEVKQPEAKPADKPRYYTEANNLYYELNGNKVAITSESNPDIISGREVSRSEFGISGGIFPSPDGLSVAFYQKDVSKVADFPLLDITTRTGSLENIKYPQNGLPSERVSLGIYNTATGSTVWCKVTDFDEERYLTNITWSPDGRLVYIQVLNRAQKEMHLNSYCAATGEFVEQVCTDTDPRYVEPSHPLYFIGQNPNKFIYTTNVRDGYWNFYLYERGSSSEEWSCRRIVDVDADIYYLGQDSKSVYYYSFEFSPVEQHLCKVDIKSGRTMRLTKAEGWHNCTLSPDGKWFFDNYSSLNVPRVVNVASTDGKVCRTLFEAPNPTTEFNYTPIELGSIKSADGKFDNYYRLIYPIDFDPAKKYPAILYVYGGPHSQMVNNTFCANLRRWEMYMAQRGYVVFVMDNRGTKHHGAEYEKAIHRQCGQAEMADQMKGIEWLTSHSWVDADRIGVHGWSYGGFMTISLITTYPEVFKVGVAGGPVIDWKWYEVMYGERYMETEATNPEGFAKTSLINQVKNLKGKLLICQGAIDPVVLWQHSLSFVRECVVNNVQVDYFPYPRHEHNVIGRDRVHLMNKVSLYFDDYLK